MSFQVSCSYGPGQLMIIMNLKKWLSFTICALDWKRNFETVLQLLSSGKLTCEELISEVIPLEDFNKIYGDIGNSKSIATILNTK